MQICKGDILFEKENSYTGKQGLRTFNPYPDDALLCESFNSLGHEAKIICWDDEDINYTQYDCAIVRACWDYDRRLPEFLKRLSHISRYTVLFNPYQIIRENTDKRYLLELEKAVYQ